MVAHVPVTSGEDTGVASVSPAGPPVFAFPVGSVSIVQEYVRQLREMGYSDGTIIDNADTVSILLGDLAEVVGLAKAAKAMIGARAASVAVGTTPVPVVLTEAGREFAARPFPTTYKLADSEATLTAWRDR